MSQIPLVSSTIKQLLKQQKLTYKDVAEHLQLSEASVKRMFSNEQFSLQKLESMCELLQLTLCDLFDISQTQQAQISQLTVQQEQELMDNPKLFLVAVCVRDGWLFEDIISQYCIEELECVRLMARLDKLSMIQLLPNNNYKLLIAQDFNWIPGGPLERYIEQQVIGKFLQGDFNQEECYRFYLRGSYSDATIATIKRRLQQLTKEVAQLNEQDIKLPLNKRQGVGLLLAMRPWQLGQFKSMLRNSPDLEPENDASPFVE
ncbi:helix-turn-helix transcriptional regulator [Pseudoalteromonas sp. SMS1]|uniref:helix-turn-helix domain-containing protein n=1 Tax=Pseudoalteromonas sp. SMS1 TaxID=2908894 RepID=UPI001F4331EB|nr:helix-turn-helix transcriptional regulator [Pseudoalteromonas sp. SMS1]MCF2858314.1 helix-turn-helix transcriptional regulator [Pseudoalteromonas sp. SMS1]